MSSSSNLPTPDPAARRRLLLALAAVPFAPAALAEAEGAPRPHGRPGPDAGGTGPLAGLARWGSGEFRRFGFLVYEATLWAGDDPRRPPLALRLDYRRSIAGRAIAEASVDEMRRLGTGEAELQAWGGQMAALFPDVKPGDHIVGLHLPEEARFYYNGRLLGSIAGAGFARRFFAIWLDPRTSAPELRAALLRRPGA